jgi:pilus assembly protein Flp/PilA
MNKDMRREPKWLSTCNRQSITPGKRWELNLLGEITMKDMMLKLYIKTQNLLNNEDGQDLIEYALLASLLAVGAVAVLGPLATAVNAAFTSATTAITPAAH